MNTPHDDAVLALDAAAAGVDILRSMYGTDLERYGKSATDFATAADIAAEEAVRTVILTARGDTDAFVGEESGAHGDIGNGRTRLVDLNCDGAAGEAGIGLLAADRATHEHLVALLASTT